MYPLARFALAALGTRTAPPLPLDGLHVSRVTCLPWDLDPWMELNNGRTLTFYDLGRVPLAMRTGLVATLRRQRWGLAVAGATVRYRRRVRAFQRLEMRSRCLGRDARFFYLHQSLWRRGEAVSAALFRGAVTRAAGIVPTDEVMEAHGAPDWAPSLPDWVRAWSATEDARPWPPGD